MHRLAAGWIEALAGDRPEDLADMVAHHYLSALDLDRRSGREDPELAARARTALVEAGDRSSALNAFPAAARFYEQALELSTERDADRPRVLLAYGRALFHAEGGGKDALQEAADAFLEAGEREQAALALVSLADFLHFIEGNSPEASANLDLAVSLVEDAPPSPVKAGVLANRARFHMISDQTDQAIRIADEALALATRLELEDLQAHTLNTRGVARTLNGDLGGVEDLERAVEIAPPLSFELMRALNNLVSTLVELGDLERGFALMERTLEAARRHGHVVAMAWVETQELDRLYWLGEWDELLSRAEQMLDDSSSATPTLMAIDAYIFRARLRLAKGTVWRRRSRTRRRLSSSLGPRAILRWRSRLSPHAPRSCTRPANPRRRARSGRRAPLTMARKPNIRSRPLGRGAGACAGRARARHRAPRSKRGCAPADAVAQRRRNLCRRRRGPRRSDVLRRIGAPTPTRPRHDSAPQSCSSPRTGATEAEAQLGLALDVLPRRGRRSATSARPRSCSRSASRRPGRDRRLRARGSPRDPAARRTR